LAKPTSIRSTSTTVNQSKLIKINYLVVVEPTPVTNKEAEQSTAVGEERKEEEEGRVGPYVDTSVLLPGN